jgi:hypothetical protein
VWEQRDLLQWSDLPMFAIGTVFAFFSAWLCIRWLIRYVSTHDFTVFAWYRIRVWGGGAVDGVYGVGGVERVKSGHLIRSNFLRDFGFYYELLLRPDRKYYSHE